MLLAEMTADIALWVFGVAVVPILAWAAYVTTQLSKLNKNLTDQSAKVNLLVEMHNHPDQYNFGSQSTNQLLRDNTSMIKTLVKDNTAAMRALTHYIRWLGKEQTGKTPPPPTIPTLTEIADT